MNIRGSNALSPKAARSSPIPVSPISTGIKIALLALEWFWVPLGLIAYLTLR